MVYEEVEGIEDLVTVYERVRASEDRAGAYRSARISDDVRTRFVEHVNGCPELGICATLAESVIGSLVARNCEEGDFYAQLASFVFDSELLSGKIGERLVAFGISLIDQRLPYRHYEVVTMDNRRFSQVSETWAEEIGEVRRIAHRPFLQKTEEASAVLDIIENLEGFDVRCVLLAHYLDELRSEFGQGENG